MTDAHPSGFVDVETPGVEWLATDIQRDIVDVLADQPSATAREIAVAVDCSKRHVLDTLETLAENDLVDRHGGAGDYGADLFRLDGDGAAVVDLGFSEIANDPLCDSSRWSFAISLPTLVETPSPGESNATPPRAGETSGGGSAGPPPG